MDELYVLHYIPLKDMSDIVEIFADMTEAESARKKHNADIDDDITLAVGITTYNCIGG